MTPQAHTPHSVRKPRTDSKLKTLPYAQQKQIMDWLRTSTYAEVVDRIHTELNLDTSLAALSHFHAWFHLAYPLEQFLALAQTAQAYQSDQLDFPSHSHALSQATQALFEAKAATDQNFPLFQSLRRLRQKDRDQDLMERRLKVLEREVALKEAATAPSHRRRARQPYPGYLWHDVLIAQVQPAASPLCSDHFGSGSGLLGYRGQFSAIRPTNPSPHFSGPHLIQRPFCFDACARP